MFAEGLFLTNIVQKSVTGVAYQGADQDSTGIAQVCLRQATIKGHSKYVQLHHTEQRHRCRKFCGAVQLAC